METIRQYEDIATGIVDACIQVHRELGAGLMESAYQACLEYELTDRGFGVERELLLPIRYRGLTIDVGYRMDMLVDGRVVIESKCVHGIHPVHEAQLLTYLRLSGHKLGFLINWNVRLIRDGIRRMVNNY